MNVYGIDWPTDEHARPWKYDKTGAVVRDAGGDVVFSPRFNAITDALLDVEWLTSVQGVNAVELLGQRHASNVRAWLATTEAALTGSWLAPIGIDFSVTSRRG